MSTVNQVELAITIALTDGHTSNAIKLERTTHVPFIPEDESELRIEIKPGVDEEYRTLTLEDVHFNIDRQRYEANASLHFDDPRQTETTMIHFGDTNPSQWKEAMDVNGRLVHSLSNSDAIARTLKGVAAQLTNTS